MLVFIIVILALIFLYNHFTKYNNYWVERNVPGPKPSFFFGNIRDDVLRKKATCEIFADICAQYPEEKVIGAFRLRTPILLIKDLDIIKDVLISNFHIFTERGLSFDESDLGSNMLHSSFDTWRVLRSKFTPIFTSGKLKSMTYLVDELGNRLLDYLDKQIEAQPEQDVHRLAKKFTQSAIAACAFGIDVDSFDDEFFDALRIVDQKVLHNTYAHEFEMMYPGILKKLKFPLFPKEVKAFFLDLTRKVIALRNGEPIGRNDFFDQILAMRKDKYVAAPKKGSRDEREHLIEITDEIIAAQSFVFFVGGNETSAVTVGNLFYLLARNQDIQDKVEAEIRQVLQKYGGKLTYDAVSELTYMDKVLNESLRLHLVGEGIRRCPNADYKLPETDVVVKKGQIVFIPLNVVHRDPKQYPNPDKFDPERFSPENIATRHSCAYLPFGLGPRNCIGLRFGRLQIKLLTAKLLSKYRVEPSKNTQKNFKYVPSRLVQKPIGGFPLKLIKRQL